MKPYVRLTFIIGLFCAMTVACSDDPVIEPPVETVSVSEISLSPSMLLLEEGKNVLLKATILPENATDKRLTWKSDNEKIASVNSEGNISAHLAGETIIRATTADGNKQAICTVIVSEKSEDPTKAKRTVLVYISADNNLQKFAMNDLKEMKAGMASINEPAMHLLVYMDTGSSPQLFELKNENGNVSEVTIKTYAARNSVGLEEMKEVFQDVFQASRYKAESYGLVFWSHCDGWIPYPVPKTRWIGQDIGGGNEDNRMNLDEFATLLSTSAPHLDFLLFDACFMQSVEAAYELRHFADYYVGSPTETPGPGAPYDRIVPYMFMKGAAADMAKAYFKTYEAMYKDGDDITNDNWTGGTSITAVDLRAMETLAKATRDLVATATGIDPQKLRPLVFDYDMRDGSSHIGYYDLKEMMNLLTQDAVVFNAWEAAYDATVAYWNTTPRNYSAFYRSRDGMFDMKRANGVTHYIPSSTTAAALTPYHALEWYQDAGLELLGW